MAAGLGLGLSLSPQRHAPGYLYPRLRRYLLHAAAPAGISDPIIRGSHLSVAVRAALVSAAPDRKTRFTILRICPADRAGAPLGGVHPGQPRVSVFGVEADPGPVDF